MIQVPACDLPKVGFQEHFTCCLSARWAPQGFAKYPNDIVVDLKYEGGKSMPYGRLETLDDLFPVFSQIIIDIVIIWAPYEHVRSLTSLRETKVFRVDLHNMSTVRAYNRQMSEHNTLLMNRLWPTGGIQL